MSHLSYKTLFIILFLLLIPAVFFFRINQKSQTVSAAWWNDSWTYRTSINIGNSGSSQNNVQIKILDNYDLSTLIIAEKIQASLNDLRFVDINGELISYWIEDSTNNSVDIWGIIPSLPTGDSTIYMYYDNPSAPSASSTSNMTIGGTMSFVDGYRIHTFNSSATLTNTNSTNVEILIVAGGGGGAAMTGGGGGAGGLIYNSSYAVTAQDYSVTVGLGGSGQVGTANPGNGSDGQNSIFDSLIAIGGGGAGTNSGVGRSGGSGGGAGHNNTPGGVGTSGQGNNGSGGITTAPNYGAGGGGGAGAVGGTPTNYAGGNGGIGLAYSISGTSQYYAGGGGGGTYMGGTYGLGGSGGGGNAPAGNAIPNTGGGGGGQINNQANAGNGASGIIIIRYQSATANPPANEEARPSGIGIGGTGNETHSGNLVAYYKFDEGYGLVANNSGSIGSTINGSIIGSTWTTSGKIGKALSFDGNNDYVDIGTIPINYETDSWSTTAWIKVNSLGNIETFMGWGTGDISPYYYWMLKKSNTDKLEFWAYNGSNTSLVSNTNISVGWHFISLTHNPSGNLTIYLDGKQENSTSSVGFIKNRTDSWNKNTLGYYIWSNGSEGAYLDGNIDEVKIYDYVLTPEEVSQDFNSGASAIFGVTDLTIGNTSTSALYCLLGSTDPCSPPIVEWNFEEGVGNTAHDTSTNANHASTTGSVWSTGKVGKALQFISSNNSYLISSSDPGTMSSGTYSLWVKPSTINATMGWIDSNFDIFQWTGNLLYFRAGNQSSVSLSNWSPNTWHHLALIWDGSNYYGYIDGNQVTTGVQSGSRSGTISMGRVDSNYYFDGSIDQVRIYNYARTPAQIAWDYNQGAPITHFKFDECQGNILHSSTSIGITGTINIGASGSQSSLGSCTTSDTWYNGATGKFNSSLSLDGVDDKATSGTLTIGTNMTISAWIKKNTSTGQRSFFSNRNGGNVYLGLAGTQIFLYDNAATPPNINSSSGTITIGQWQHIVATSDGTTTNFYLNGLLVKSSSQSRTSSTGTVGIGWDPSIDTEYWDGQIDDLRIYNYTLTSEQIKHIYNGGAINFN